MDLTINFEQIEYFHLDDLADPVLNMITKIRMPFDKLCRLVPKGLPIFYKVHLPLLSRLNLQKKRFSETYFLYYFTKYRQQLYQEIMEGCKNKKLTNISITGLKCTGKSYFLADFVLRQRALGEKSEFRILYINSNQRIIYSLKYYLRFVLTLI